MTSNSREPFVQHNFRLYEGESRLGLIVANQAGFDKVAPFAAHLVRSSIVSAAEDGTIRAALNQRAHDATAELAALDAHMERLASYLDSLRSKR